MGTGWLRVGYGFFRRHPVAKLKRICKESDSKMAVVGSSTTGVEDYFNMIKNLSRDKKLDLIKKISESLKGDQVQEKDNSWRDFFGAWESEDSAEEIIGGIREDRFTNRKTGDL